MLRNKIIIVFILLIASYLLPSQNEPKFKHLTTQDGFSGGWVKKIHKDSKGFMWFCSNYGVNRYNGYEFKVFAPNDKVKNSLSHNNTTSIIEDSEGKIWIGTLGGGINIFRPETNDFFTYQTNPVDTFGIHGNSIFTIFEDSKGIIWIGTYLDGINRYDRKTKKFYQYLYSEEDTNSIIDNSSTSIIEDSKGVIWIATYGKGLCKYNPDRDNFTRVPIVGENMLIKPSWFGKTIFEDSKKNIWIGTETEGVFFWNRKNNTFKHYSESNIKDHLSENIVTSITEDSNGRVWVGTDHGGINIFNLKENTITYLVNNEKHNSSISSNAIYSLYTDNDGIVWAGNYNTGISFYNKFENQFEIIEPNPENSNSLSYKIITSIFEDKDNVIWIGTDGGGLNKYEPDIKRFTHYKHNEKDPNSIIGDVIMSIDEDPQGNLWIGTYARGVSVMDRKNGKFKHLTAQRGNSQTISHNTVWVIRHISDSTMWIGTKGGIDIFNLKSKTFTHLKYSNTDSSSISNNDITDFYADIYGYVWIGTHFGLNRYDPKTGRNIRFMPDSANPEGIHSPVIRCITGAKDGDLWIGTGSGQVLKHLPKTKAFIPVFDEKFQFTNIAYLQEDSANNLWIATNKGICRFNYLTKNYKIFYKSDGLVGDEFKRDAALISSSGKYYFGSNSGINVFEPHQIIENKNAPKVYITGFQIFNKEISPQSPDSPLKVDISLTNSLTLSYKQSVFSFEFIAINYLQPERNTYAYMLKGFDADWYNIGNKRSATFTNISPGTYTFRVKAANNDGIWNNEGTSLTITILPPWWKTLWFKLLAIVTFAALLLLAYFIRVTALKIQKQDLEIKVKERTTELLERQEEILQQQEEIKSQKDELQAQNKLLENKNEEIEIQKHTLARQKRTIERDFKNIKIISDFGQKVTSSLNINDIQQMVYEYINSIKNVNAFGIGVYNETKAIIEFHNFVEHNNVKPFYFVKISDFKLLSVKCFLSKQVIVNNQITEEYQEYLQKSVNIQHIPNSSVYIPLIIDKREIGVLYASSEVNNGFSEREITNLKALSSYIAIAYDNARAYKLIQLKNESINGSIRYGLTIQKAMLITEEELNKKFESFVVYIPKDIVSGDFYWFSETNQSPKNQSNTQFLALVDCTGHGVPGAFMSMIGNRLLSEIINAHKINDPVMILKHLDIEVVNALMQNTSDNNDGMDLSLVRIDTTITDKTKNIKLTFAGAKMPLFYYNSLEKTMTKIEGTRKSIGGFESGYNKNDFSQKSFNINKGDIIYLASDGIIDQSNNSKKKYGNKRFMEVLQNSANLPMSEQKTILLNSFYRFMEEQDQRDDVSVLGIKF